MNATMSAPQPLAGAPVRGAFRWLSVADVRRAAKRRGRSRRPEVPVILNAPQRFGTSFRYPDGSWFHGE